MNNNLVINEVNDIMKNKNEIKNSRYIVQCLRKPIAELIQIKSFLPILIDENKFIFCTTVINQKNEVHLYTGIESLHSISNPKLLHQSIKNTISVNTNILKPKIASNLFKANLILGELIKEVNKVKRNDKMPILVLNYQVSSQVVVINYG